MESRGQAAIDPRMLALARRYVWWKRPEEAMEFPQRVIAQVMDLGTFEDLQELRTLVGEDAMRDALADAVIGQFRPASWSFWHYVLNGLTGPTLPPLPSRRFL